MAVSMIGPKFYAWDRDGNPLAFGKVYTYKARTNAPKDTFQSEDGIVANTNPVILNGEGYANIYLDGSYKIVVKDSDENEIWTADPVSASSAEEWVDCVSVTYLSPTSFKVSGNVTDSYPVGCAVRIDNGVGFEYSIINSSSYGGSETTIIVSDAVVDTGVIGVCSSIVKNASLLPVTATGTTTPRSLADWMRDTIKCPDGINTEIVAGILRKDSIGTATWSFLHNVDHATVGINNPDLAVTAVGESLTINFGKTYKKVVSFICGPDETLTSKLNAKVGASVGLSTAEIRLGISAECSGVVRWNGSGGVQDVELGPFFVNPTTTMSNGLAKTTIDALSSPYVSKDDSISISPYSGSANIVPFMPCLKSYGYDSHDVNFINNYGSSFYAGGPSLNIGYLWNRSVCRPAILDGREAAAFESILAGPSSNIWFLGVFEV